MKKILEGVKQFKKTIYPERKALFHKLATGQSPDFLFITCADSRIDPGLLTQADPGELFICRNAGNIVPPHTRNAGGMTASIEFAVAALEVPHIIICGHTDCGAMRGALNLEGLTHLPHVHDWLDHSRAAATVVKSKYADASDGQKLQALTRENILLQLQHIRTHPSVAERLALGKVDLHGWVYDIETGDVEAYDPQTDSFRLLEEIYDDDGQRRALT